MTQTISTKFTKIVQCRYPIISGPMFLLSDENLVTAAGNAGILGGMPSLNWRSTDAFRKAVDKVKSALGDKPFAVNLIVNKSNLRAQADLKAALDGGTPVFITSLGNPKDVIEQGHKNGAKIFCDVTNLEYAKKVQDLGADGVIAVCSGAGGHAGPINPMILVPYLKKNLTIPVVLAGGVADGVGLAAAMALGADAVQMGTRFIAATECKADAAYKNAVVKAEPEDIVLTTRISGVPAAVINTPYFEKVGLDMNPVEKFLVKNEFTKKWAKLYVSLKGMQLLKNAAEKTTWKEVWSAGQSVGLIDQVEPVATIVEKMIRDYEQVKSHGLP